MLRFAWFWTMVLVLCACAGGAASSSASSDANSTLPGPTTTTSQPASPTSTTPDTTTTSTRQEAEFSTHIVGSFTSDEVGPVNWLGVDVGPDGLPVAFQSSPVGWLVVACDDWACSRQTTSVIEVGETNFPTPASIQFTPTGLPVFTTPATEHEPQMPLTIHACHDRACAAAGTTGFPTDQLGWVAVSDTGRTFIGVMAGQPMLRLFHSESPAGNSLTEVSGYPYWARSLKVDQDGSSQLILATEPERPGRSGLEQVLIIQCNDEECADPTETALDDVGIWEMTLDPMAAPRGGTAAFLGGSAIAKTPQLVLVAWQNDPATTTRVLLDEFPGAAGEIQGAAISVGPTGNPVVVWNRVYYEFDHLNEATELYVARCDTPECSTGTIVTLYRGVEQGSAGGYVGVAVGPDDNPVLIYDNWNITGERSEITLTRCSDPACTATALEIETWPNE